MNGRFKSLIITCGSYFFQLSKPFTHKPMYKFATIPWSHTDSTLSKYFRPMHAYMKNMNRSSVAEGIEAVLSGYVHCSEWRSVWRETCSLLRVAQ
jgi:hypothetical protein